MWKQPHSWPRVLTVFSNFGHFTWLFNRLWSWRNFTWSWIVLILLASFTMVKVFFDAILDMKYFCCVIFINYWINYTLLIIYKLLIFLEYDIYDMFAELWRWWLKSRTVSCKRTWYISTILELSDHHESNNNGFMVILLVIPALLRCIASFSNQLGTLSGASTQIWLSTWLFSCSLQWCYHCNVSDKYFQERMFQDPAFGIHTFPTC